MRLIDQQQNMVSLKKWNVVFCLVAEKIEKKKKGTFIPLLIINLISFRTKTDSGFIYSFKVGVVTVRDAIQMAEDTELNLVYHSFYFIFIF